MTRFDRRRFHRTGELAASWRHSRQLEGEDDPVDLGQEVVAWPRADGECRQIPVVLGREQRQVRLGRAVAMDEPLPRLGGAGPVLARVAAARAAVGRTSTGGSRRQPSAHAEVATRWIVTLAWAEAPAQSAARRHSSKGVTEVATGELGGKLNRYRPHSRTRQVTGAWRADAIAPGPGRLRGSGCHHSSSACRASVRRDGPARPAAIPRGRR